MAFDAGTIVASVDLHTEIADRKLRAFEDRIRQAERDHEIRLTAVFDTASTGRARAMFAALDNQLSRDAANRLRTSPQGSVLGALNALFSPHQVSGAPSPAQAASQGMLGKVEQAATTQDRTRPVTETVTENVRRRFIGGMLGLHFGGGGGGGGGTGSTGGGGFFGNLLAGIGPGILGIGARPAGMIGAGAGILGALPALGAIGGVLGIGGLGALSAMGLFTSGTLNANLQPLLQISQQLDNMAPPVTAAQFRHRQALQQQLQQGLAQVSPAERSIFRTLTGVQQAWQQFGVGFAPAFAKAISPLAGIFHSLQPLMKGFFSGAIALVQPLLRGIGDIAKVALPLLGQAFRAIGPDIRPLLDGIAKLLGGLLTGMVPLLKAAAPAVTAFSQTLGTLGHALGSMFADFAPVVRQSAVLMKALLDIVNALFPVIGKLAAIFATALAPVVKAFAAAIRSIMPTLVIIGRILGELAAAILGDLAAAFTALARLLVAISPSLKILANVLGNVFKTLENAGLFAVLGSAIENLVKPLAQLINALVQGLAPYLPVIFRLISVLAKDAIKVLMAAVDALIPPLIQLLNAILVPLLPVIQSLVPVIQVLARLFAAGLAAAVVLLVRITAPLIILIVKAAAAILQWLSSTHLIIPVLIGLVAVIAPIPTAIAAIGIAVGFLVTHWRQAWNDIKHWAEDAWHFIWNGFGKFLLPLLGPAGLIALGIIELLKHWTTVWGAIKQVAHDFWTWIWTDFGEKIFNFLTKTIPGWFDSLPGKALNALKNLGTDLEHLAMNAIKSMLRGFVSGAKSVGGFFANLGKGILSGISGGLTALIPGLGAGGVPGWIMAALQATHSPLSWLRPMETLVSKESGGSPRAYDPISVGGQHAEGIAQMLPSTFAQWSLGGSIWNPIANLIASLRYIRAQYGSPFNIPGLMGGGAYRGYAAGGWVTEPVFGIGMRSHAAYGFAERGIPEYVSPAGSDTGVLLREISGKLSSLIAVARHSPRQTSAGVGRALSGAVRGGAYQGIYGSR